MIEAQLLSQEELRFLKEKYEKLFSDDSSSVAFAFLGEILRKQGG